MWKLLTYWNFKNYPRSDKLRSQCNQATRLCAKAKTHKFYHLHKIVLDKLKLRPIVDQICTAAYDDAKLNGEYLKPLPCNEYNDCLKFRDTLIHYPQIFR